MSSTITGATSPRLRLVGGPTALIAYGGLRLLTDPTFDPPGDYPRPGTAVVLRKLAGPALPAGQVDPVDAVLLSHDHHADNLDRAGRALLSRAARVLTTAAGAERLGAGATGLQAGDHVDLERPGGGRVRVTAVLAEHGPPEVAAPLLDCRELRRNGLLTPGSRWQIEHDDWLLKFQIDSHRIACVAMWLSLGHHFRERSIHLAELFHPGAVPPPNSSFRPDDVVDYVRGRVSSGESLGGLAADVRKLTAEGFALLEHGLAGYAVRAQSLTP